MRGQRLRLTVIRLAILCVFGLSGSGLLPIARAASQSNYDFVHDPSMIREGHTYYLFSTGDPQGVIGNGNVQIRTSTDLKHWNYIGTVFKDIPNWVTLVVGSIPNLWAPDISYYHGKYQLYYAGSTFGTSNSVIGLATNSTLDPSSKAYHWVDQGLVVQSTQGDGWNAIDPNFSLDAAGRPWLAFGSFWSGIKLVAINPSTRKPATPTPTATSKQPLYSLAYRPDSNAVEAAFIVYRKPFYYLFASFDSCCRGVQSTYRIMVGRSHTIIGPYADRPGKKMLDGGGTQLLASAGYVRGPGGQSIVQDGGRYLLVFHYYDARDNGNAKIRIAPLGWTSDGWPMVGVALDP